MAKPKLIDQSYKYRKHKDKRPREHLYEYEIEALLTAARNGKNPIRDEPLILITYIHGLRASEATGLRWSELDLDNRKIHIRSLKGGPDATQPLTEREIRLLSQLELIRDESCPYVFMNSRGDRLTRQGFHYLFGLLASDADLKINMPHPHMLRHATGYYLTEKNTHLRITQDYMRHVNIQNTVVYTTLSDKKFVGLFGD